MNSLVIVLSVLFSLSVHAQDHVNIFNINKIIGPYPAVGTEASNKDFEILHFYQNTRTEEQCAEASLEVKPSLESFFAGKKGPLTPDEANKLKKHFLFQVARVGIDAGWTKLHYKRPRPYFVDSTLSPCIKRATNAAYPSGHTMMARYFAHLLAHIFPERAQAFMKRGEEVALNRVIGGVHHPSDLAAGKKLADVMAMEKIGKEQVLYNLSLLE